MADDLRGVIDEMKLLRIAIGGVNPDPQETIQAIAIDWPPSSAPRTTS